MDKLKEIRDKNPLLDFVAGFIPGVGEAQDVHDFAIAAKDKNFGGMALASLGLVTPFVNGNQIVKGIKTADKLVDKVKDSRKFAKATDAPIYTKETAPKKLKLDKRDVTEMHLNDDSEFSEQIFGKELITSLNKRFADADHGTAIRVGFSLDDANDGLSSASAPLFYKMSRRWAGQNKGSYFVPKGEPEMVRMNKVAQWQETPDGKVHPPFNQELVDRLNKEINEINKLGYSFKPAAFVKRQNPYEPGSVLYKQFESNKNNNQLFIPNIGFLKFNKGGIL